jgi:hypothetical protein
MFAFTTQNHLDFSIPWNSTGWHPMRDQFKKGFKGEHDIGGPLDAPEFLPVGAAQCPMSVDTFPRDEV